jgi:hypothetical protein
MTKQQPTLESWRALYQAAIAIKELKPWTFMEETEILGIEDPETGDLGFISVMGALGEHLSIAVYRGARGLTDFWEMQNLGDNMRVEDVMLTPQLQASFEDRNQLTKDDRAIIKELGLTFRGRQAWPHFRSYEPGYLPEQVNADEARLLTFALEQLAVMAPRIQEDPDLLMPEGPDDYLIRVRQTGDQGSDWQDEIRTVPPYNPPHMTVSVANSTMHSLLALPLHENTVEADLFMLSGGIGERDERPRVGFCLLLVESKNGFILGSELLTAEDTTDEMHRQVPSVLFGILERVQLRPALLVSSRQLLLSLIERFAADLDIELAYSPHLPNLDPIKHDLINRFR